ncbi:PspA/IM30 family protein [Flocculibacter collagenilyticus]|uniref:PspA/IM30 family protein n=1 Tax=Flocculibacter collagenilyticus TaxID=2744479 RepID=UPI0018F4355D|nr:PspA/IM30 family protein [Flocculibacter collagenilyticus]
MNVFKKIFTAFKGAATNIGENIIDANGISILEQELHDVRQHLVTAKQGHAEITASSLRTELAIEKIQADIEHHEQQAHQALNNDNEAVAREYAEKVVGLEASLSAEQTLLSSLNNNSKKLQQQISQAEYEIKDIENNLSQLKATESVQKAHEKIYSSVHANGASVTSAKESLARIKAKQDTFDDRLEAEEELNNETNLDRKLAQAGISLHAQSVDDVLNRVKKENVNSQ